jgi:hypothetical protein
MVGVILLPDDGCQMLPVAEILRPYEVVLVGQRPPDVRKRGEPSNDIAHVTLVNRRTEVHEPPLVIGMEQDQIRLDA